MEFITIDNDLSIDTLIVLGENQKFAAALIVPDFNDLKSWCETKGIEYTTNSEMINQPRIKKRYKKEKGLLVLC